MTNGEKYEKEIVEIAKSDKKFMCDDFIKKKVLSSYGMLCNHKCIACAILASIWLSKEYKEPEVDWNNVKVDTPILVKYYENSDWEPGHFSRFYKGHVYAWINGKTSFTTTEDNICLRAKLVNYENTGEIE